MRITDLLDQFHDDSIFTVTEDIPSADEILRLTKKKLARRENNKKRLIPSGFLIAAIITIMCISVGAAYYFGHEKTIQLIESGIYTGGNIAVEVNDTSRSVIERESQDYEKTTDTNASKVTLDSVMGFHSPQVSIVYLTLTIQLPKDLELTADIRHYGFVEWTPQLTRGEAHPSGSCTSIKNNDGSVSTMLMYIYRGDIGDNGMTLHLSDFGVVSKEAVRELYQGTRKIEMPGKWDFQIERLNLGEPSSITFDRTLFKNFDAAPSEIFLSPFGVILTFESWVEDNASIRDIQLHDYNNGIYSVGTPVVDGEDENGHHWAMSIFDAPQDIYNVEYLSINDVKVKVNYE